MSKSRGGKTSYEKQDQVYNQFQRIIRKAEFEKRNPQYAEETQVEAIIRKSKEAKEKYAATAKTKSEKVCFLDSNSLKFFELLDILKMSTFHFSEIVSESEVFEKHVYSIML